MKKILISMAVAIMTVICANAQSAQQAVPGNVKSNSTTVVTQTNDGFKITKLEELSPKVQSAIKGYETVYTAKLIAHNAEKKLTKVTLISKTDSKEKVVILNEEGVEAKQDDLLK